MRRSPIERRTGLSRGTTPMKRGKPLKRMSDKRRRAQPRYRRIKEEIVEERGTQCEFRIPNPNGVTQRCPYQANDPHHILAQSASGGRETDRTDKENIMLVCRFHHDWIGANPRMAELMGYRRRARPDGERS